MKQHQDSRVVVAEHLTQRYGRRTVISELDLCIRSGVTGLVGPNGAGKTTLLSTLATLMLPADGRLKVLGLDPTVRSERREIRRNLGYLPQSFGYIPRFSVQEFVSYVAWLKGVASQKLDLLVADAINSVDLGSVRHQAMGKLSGGMLRRVGLASALVNTPQLLILDEPTVGLDPEQRVEFRNILRRLGENDTVLLSTHLIEDVAVTCSEVIVLGNGRVTFHGPTSHLSSIGEDGEQLAGSSPLERGYTQALSGEL